MSVLPCLEVARVAVAVVVSHQPVAIGECKDESERIRDELPENELPRGVVVIHGGAPIHHHQQAHIQRHLVPIG
jgi:hypothetical protein